MSLENLKEDLWYRFHDSDIGQRILLWYDFNVKNHRSKKDISEYLDEAFDKVWFTRTSPVEDPKIEKKRKANYNRIRMKYGDLPENEWEEGYWTGVMATLRWVLGDEKHNLDT